MRFNTFMRRIIGQDTAEALAFGPEHFSEAGLTFAPLGGIPQLEAYTLVNKWNAAQANQRFVYFLGA